MRVTVLRAAIVAKPDVIASSCKNKGISSVGIIPDPLHHVAILSVHHQDSRLLDAGLDFTEGARYAVQREHIVVRSNKSIALCSKAILLADFFHTFESIPT